jgi:hypothetical protein
MEIVKVNTKKLGLSKAYLTLFNGSLRLTDRELDLLSSLLDKYMELRGEGLKEPFLSKFVFSTEIKREVQSIMGINSQYFQNIVSNLVKKGVLSAEGTGLYTFNPSIIPRKEIGFRFG